MTCVSAAFGDAGWARIQIAAQATKSTAAAERMPLITLRLLKLFELSIDNLFGQRKVFSIFDYRLLPFPAEHEAEELLDLGIHWLFRRSVGVEIDCVVEGVGSVAHIFARQWYIVFCIARCEFDELGAFYLEVLFGVTDSVGIFGEVFDHHAGADGERTVGLAVVGVLKQ